MFRKMIAVVMSVVLAVCLTACVKGKKEQEKKEPRKPHGYRVYLTFTDAEGKVRDTHELQEEYEDLVTEATLKTYDSDGKTTDPSSITKWYYDDTGEILLKKVEWSEAEYLLTISTEYDFAGRIIRYSEMQKDSDREDMYGVRTPALPSEYYTILSVPAMDVYSILGIFYNFELKDGVKELVTEYTYREDSDRYASIRTVADGSDVIAGIEWDGDTILSARLESPKCRYEETYQPDNHKAEWKIFDEQNMKRKDTELAVHYGGEKEYDDSGRCVHTTEYEHTQEGNRWFLGETVISYDDEGCVVTAKHHDYLVDGAKHSIRYDLKGREVREEWYGFDDSTGNNESILKTVKNKTYFPNGQLAVETGETWISEEKTMKPYLYEEYNEEGELLVQRTYLNGKLERETIIDFPEEPGVSGKVKHELDVRYTEKGTPRSREEQKYVSVTRGGETSWIEYYYLDTIYETDYEDTNDFYKATFDDKGRLIRLNSNFDGDYYNEFEYDASGRVVRYATHDGASCTEKVYEYWENEPGSTGGEAK